MAATYGTLAREIRQSQGKTLGEISRAMKWSAAKVSAIELDRRSPPKNNADIRKFAKICNSEDQAEELVHLAELSRRSIKIRGHNPLSQRVILKMKKVVFEQMLDDDEYFEIEEIIDRALSRRINYAG